MKNTNNVDPRGLAGKRVLFVAPRFFHYEKDIIEALQQFGAEVDWLPDRPFDSSFMTAVTRFQPRFILPCAYRMYQKMMTDFGRSHYDFVLVLNGQTLPKKLLVEWRTQFPNARFILYMWDSIENRGSVRANLDQFDECLSFDPGAVGKYGMTLRPLYFVPGFETTQDTKCDYDISFIGTAHSDRYEIVSKINAGLPAHISRYWYLFLQAKWVYYAYRRTNKAYKSAILSDFQFASLPRATVQETFRRSMSILDIEHPSQTGLTMRTFETLGAQKKLVTTNASVRDYPFFDANNIHVIDRLLPIIPEDFIKTPYRPILPELYYKYSISGWVRDVMGLGSRPIK
jgi:hypothetical protein